jgi:hypothetical protein
LTVTSWAFSGERVEVEGQGGDEGLAFAGGHLGDFALVEGDAADELHVEMNHVPDQLMVADHDGASAEAAGGVLHRGEGLGKDGVEGLAGLHAGAELVGLGA